MNQVIIVLEQHNLLGVWMNQVILVVLDLLGIIEKNIHY